jgi:hypothetical protein
MPVKYEEKESCASPEISFENQRSTNYFLVYWLNNNKCAVINKENLHQIVRYANSRITLCNSL